MSARIRSALPFSLLAALTLFSPTASALSLITDPIPEPIVPSGLRTHWQKAIYNDYERIQTKDH